MKEKVDIVVIGGGITGCAVLHELSKQGFSVVLLEAQQIASGTTGDSGGFIRKFNSDPYIANLSSESFDYYGNFEKETGLSCGFTTTGFTSFVSAQVFEKAREHVQDLQSSGYPLSIHADAPFGFLQNYYGGKSGIYLHEPTAGCIDTSLACHSWVQASLKKHASVSENTYVESIEALNSGSYLVHTFSQEKYLASQVIVTAGAWTRKLLISSGIYMMPLESKSFQYNIYAGGTECLPTAFLDAISGFYLFPLRNGNLLAGLLSDDRLVSNFQFNHVSDYESKRQLHDILSERFPWIEKYELVSANLSYDGFTENERGMISALPKLPGVIIASGWSGGGIKIAPAVARRVAEIVTKKSVKKELSYAS